MWVTSRAHGAGVDACVLSHALVDLRRRGHGHVCQPAVFCLEVELGGFIAPRLLFTLLFGKLVRDELLLLIVFLFRQFLEKKKQS